MKIVTLSLLLTSASALASPYVLWYDKPAAPGMNEALPIGGGKFGGLIYGAPEQERIVLNEISLWTGTEISSDDYGKMGSYQMLGELLVQVPEIAVPGVAGAIPATGAQDYRRALDLATAVHSVSYRVRRRHVPARSIRVAGRRRDGVAALGRRAGFMQRHGETEGRAPGERQRLRTARWPLPARCRTG